MEVETGIEPVCTALQAVASPLGHSTARSSPTSRADDGIRTRDPHLGKVMRYQLRYIRTLPGALPAPCCEKNTSRRCWCTQIAWLRQEMNYNDAIRWVSERRLRARRVGAEPPGWGGARRQPPSDVADVGTCRPAAVMTSRFSTPAAGVLVFSSFRRERHACERSRGSVGERPLHTRKVAGSIPAGTTTRNRLFAGGFLRFSRA